MKNWNLVFTRSGKYFFYNDQSGERCWIPPVDVIDLMKKTLGPTKIDQFFDPFYVEEEEEEEEEEEFVVSESEDSSNCTGNRREASDPKNNEAEDEFKVYLLKNSLDPFSPWPKILEAHSSSPEFVAIPSDRRRQDLFTQVCPLLIEQKRELTRKRLEDAKEWWRRIKEDNWRSGASWFQVIKNVKGSPKFALLNEKECEKEYKNRK